MHFVVVPGAFGPGSCSISLNNSESFLRPTISLREVVVARGGQGVGATLRAGSATEVAVSTVSAGSTVFICSSESVEVVAEAGATDVTGSSGCSVGVSSKTDGAAGVAGTGV